MELVKAVYALTKAFPADERYALTDQLRRAVVSIPSNIARFLDNNFPSKAYSYEISNIETLRGTAAPVARPSNKISMDVCILLNGVCDVNGVPLLDVCEIEDAANGS